MPMLRSRALPLYVRAGSILPLGPDEEWSTQKPADPIELRIYRGADGDFTLYEDENDNYDYEKGAYATIPIHWDDGKQALTIGDRKGQFPGMLKSRSFRIVFVGQNHGVGIDPENRPDKTVQYSGKQVSCGSVGPPPLALFVSRNAVTGQLRWGSRSNLIIAVVNRERGATTQANHTRTAV